MISRDNLNYRWVILFMLVCFQIVLSFVAFGWGALAPFLKKLMSLNSTETGLINSTFFITCSLSSSLSGIFVDRYGERPGLLISLGVTALPLICLSFVYSNYVTFLIMVAIAGFGYGMSTPAAAKGLLVWFDQKTRGTVFGIRQSSVTLGGAIASIFLVYVCQKVGPIIALVILGSMIAIMLILAYLFYHTREMEKKIAINDAQNENNHLLESESGGLFTNKLLVGLYVAGSVVGLAQGTITSFFLIYIHEGLAYSVSEAGYLLGVLMISGTVGRVFWGVISDRLFGGRRKPVLIAISVLLTLSVAALAFWSPAWQKSLFLPVVILIGLSSIGWPGIFTVMLAEASIPSKAASAVGLGATIGWAGMFVGPLVFGALTDNFGYFYAWICLVGFSLVSLILCFLLPAHKPYSSPVMRQT